MGGQACVFYGAAEFSRDVDLFIAVDESNLSRLRSALQELGAESIAVPPLENEYLTAVTPCISDALARTWLD